MTKGGGRSSDRPTAPTAGLGAVGPQRRCAGAAPLRLHDALHAISYATVLHSRSKQFSVPFETGPFGALLRDTENCRVPEEPCAARRLEGRGNSSYFERSSVSIRPRQAEHVLRDEAEHHVVGDR